jgi:hypothetical protein
MDAVGEDASPTHRTPDKILEGPLSTPIADPQWDGTAQHRSEMDVPVEDPTSDEDENFLVRPSPTSKRPRSADIQNNSTAAGNTTSVGAHSPHLRISHAKLRSLPTPTIELDSDGEEMSSSDGSFSPPATSQMSGAASSCLDLVGTLPSEVGDFLDMVGSDTSSDV